MQIITTREFRANQKKYFELASMPHVLSDIETRFRKFIKKHGLSMRFIDI